MMLKKSLLALSLAAAVGTVSAADTPSALSAGGKGLGTLDKVKAQTVSKQGAVSTVELKDITFTITTAAKTVGNYDSLASILVVFDGATLAPSSNIEVGAAQGSRLSVEKVAYPNASSIEFTMKVDKTNLAEGETVVSAGEKLTLSGVDLNVSGANVSATVTAISSIADAVIDSASGVILGYVDEYSAKVTTAFNGVIDVAEERKEFLYDANSSSNAADSATQDSVVITFSDLETDHGDTSASISAGDVVTTLKGDFNFLDADANGKIDSGTLSGTVATDLLSTSLKTADEDGDKETFIVKTDGKVVIPAQSYTADVVVSYTNSAAAGKVTISGLKAGTWTLNGDSSDIAFMPFGSQYANSITVTNMSSLPGEITVTLTDGGESVSAEVGVAAAKSVTQIGKEVAKLAAANGMTQANVSVVVNATNTTVVGVYYSKADGDRVLTK